ncbi:hypothetical protein GGR88_001381 [Sphingomonas jejuensis]|uniref:PAS domain-containing protein n=1 Tax=Sphingomonas jejuensis TaxID=904715 RepID=A0ABX0XM13_9SPHN|nr:hypothetical protein [Sphingomonas jejuensis]NJC33907.1 hypothetical protein [Sphingomonas jejuensis]
MDRLGDFESDGDDADTLELEMDEGGVESPAGIGTDERRLHVRAYNYWVSLLGGRAYPSIEDLDPSTLDEFGPNSVLLDFTAGVEDPGISWLGRDLREECGLSHSIRSVGDVPGRSLLSRLTDHYLQIIANRAPVGFEAEFTNLRGNETLYRGILMPFSSDDDSIDFVYGVISWKEIADTALTQGLEAEIANLRALEGQAAAAIAAADRKVVAIKPQRDAVLQDNDVPDLSGLGIAADLVTRLTDAQATARNAKVQEGRSRNALYQALGRAHDFALAADAAPDDFDRIVAEAGLTSQDRAPMTPVVKLVFGRDYDKTRLTEYAAALSYARRRNVPLGGFPAFVEAQGGGLKALVVAERRHRMPGMEIDRGEEAREKLRNATPCALIDVETHGDEFVVLIARREEDGSLAVLAPLEGDRALLERAVRLGAR